MSDTPDAERLAEMAQFVVHLHMRPADYWALTLPERNAIAEELNATAAKRR